MVQTFFTWMKRSISDFEKLLSVMTRRARRADQAVSRRRRVPSRNENHSGCAKYDTSWIVSTRGAVTVSGAVYPGANSTSARAAATAPGSAICSQDVPPLPVTIDVANGQASAPGIGACAINVQSWCRARAFDAHAANNCDR